MADRPSGTAGESGDRGDQGEGSIPDAEWEAFQREAAQSADGPRQAGTAPKEPSARARMVAARLRERDEAAAATQRGRFGKRKQPEPWQPEGWRTGPAWQEMQGGGTWRRSRRVGVVFAVLCLLVAGLWFVEQRGHLDFGSLGTGPGSTEVEPLAAETARPTGAPPTSVLSDLPTPEHPWRGSPARRWQEGADALVLPEAERTGDVSAAALSDALKDVREFLVATQLDRDTLNGARPERALELLDPKNPALLRSVREALADPTAENDGSALFTRFDPDEVRLVGDAVKVRGRITVEEGDRGQAVVRTDHSFVYALGRADGGDEVARVLVRRAFAFDVLPAGWGTSTPGTVWLWETKGEWAGIRCDAARDGLLHPSFPTDRPSGERDGPTFDPYDRSRKAGGGDGDPDTCGTATRV